jgi:hypothetical protein
MFMYRTARLGNWAFCALGMGVEDAGFEPGPGIKNFEILAGLSGLQKVLEIDHTPRQIRVIAIRSSGCDFFGMRLERTALPSRRTFDRVRDLYTRAADLKRDERLC